MIAGEVAECRYDRENQDHGEDGLGPFGGVVSHLTGAMLAATAGASGSKLTKTVGG